MSKKAVAVMPDTQKILETMGEHMLLYSMHLAVWIKTWK